MYGTYLCRFIRDKTRGMDLHVGPLIGINSSALKVVCPAGNWSEKFKENSQNSFGTTYPVVGNVTLEGGVMDLHSALMNINSSALEVWMSTAGNCSEIFRQFFSHKMFGWRCNVVQMKAGTNLVRMHQVSL
jgi:hypothetical protein